MGNKFGTISRGVKAPIIREGDNLRKIVVDSVTEAATAEGVVLKDRDVVSITEAVVARAQGNYASVDQMAKDFKEKMDSPTVGVIFPILSRNRFSLLLKSMARGLDKIVLMLSYPSDEVGNELITMEMMDEKNVNPYTDILTKDEFRTLFGYEKHPFTGVDYISFYEELIKAENCQVEIIFANHPKAILDYTDHVITCDVHSRVRTKRILEKHGAKKVLNLEDFLTSSVDGSGYNENYGLLGSNKATEESVKLFPRDCQSFVDDVQKGFREKTGKTIEVMIYGDGAFKDPVGKIWELADPVVSPAYTEGLKGQPNEIKLKYVADNEFAHLSGDALKEAVSKAIKEKGSNLLGDMASEGTTPRRLVDLLGSLSDLTSGSGDKGTPIILIQGYFDNYTD